jgi:hypothetical protein
MGPPGFRAIERRRAHGGKSHPRRDRRSVRAMERRALVLPAVAAVAFAAFWWSNHRAGAPTAIPAASWCLGAGPGYTLGRPGDELAAGTPFRLRVQCGEPRHVYVVRHGDVDGTVLLHPAPGLPGGVDQPVPPPAAWLPGPSNDVDRVWATPADATTFVVVAAAGPVAELDVLLPKLRRARSAATADVPPPAAAPADGTAVVAGAPGGQLPSPLLQRAADLARTTTMSNGPLTPDTVLAGVWVGGWRVKPKAAPPPAGR